MSKSRCDMCVADKSFCAECCENPIYANVPIHSLFQAYKPTCPRGYLDCVNDPAYLKAYHPDYYHDTFGDLTPEKASAKSCQERVKEDPDEEYYCYDDEDK